MSKNQLYQPVFALIDNQVFFLSYQTDAHNDRSNSIMAQSLYFLSERCESVILQSILIRHYDLTTSTVLYSVPCRFNMARTSIVSCGLFIPGSIEMRLVNVSN